MATKKEKMKNALAALGELLMSPGHVGSFVIRKGDGLDESQIKLLLEIGCLREPVDGWYVVCRNEDSHDPANWYRVFWQFIAEYLDDRYQKQWCLSPGCSIDFISGETLIPEELVIRSETARGTVTELPFGTCLVEVSGDVPEDAVREDRYGVRLFPPHKALLKVSDDFLDRHCLEARTCLAAITDPSDLIKAAKEEYYPERALGLAKEMRNFGRGETADAITQAIDEYMKGAEKVFFPQHDRPLRMTQTGTIGNRIRQMWRLMRPQVRLVKEGMDCRGRSRSVKEIILRLEHTLESEFLEVPNKTEFEADLPELREDYKSVTLEAAAKGGEIRREEVQETCRKIDMEGSLSFGLHNAFKKVAKDILDSLTGGSPIANLAAHHCANWNYSLFKPGIDEGMFDASEHLHDRQEGKDTCITGARHIPFDAERVKEAMDALSEAFQREDDPFVRAVLGHFFLIYIQPFNAGNILTAWLLMNSQLVAAGYPWIALPEYYRDEYMEALKEAAELEHTDRLAALMARLIRSSWNTDLRKVDASLEYMEEGISGE